MEKLVLIDGHSILNRAFYGVPELSLIHISSYIPDNQNGEEVRKTVEDSADFCKEMYEKYYAGEAK